MQAALGEDPGFKDRQGKLIDIEGYILRVVGVPKRMSCFVMLSRSTKRAIHPTYRG